MVIYRTLEHIQQHLATVSQASSQVVFDAVSTDSSPSKQEERILYLDVGSSYLKLGIWSAKKTLNSWFGVYHGKKVKKFSAESSSNF